MSITALMFISTIAILVSIYVSSGSSFTQIQGSITSIALNNANIGMIGNSNTVLNNLNGQNANSTQITNGPIVGSCTANNILGDLYCDMVNAGNLIKAGFQTAYCDTLGGLIANAMNNGVSCFAATNIGNGLSGSTNIQQSIGQSVGANVQNEGVSNNALILSVSQLVSTPFSQAMLILGTFLALGILAGLLGAGILARIMALAGLALSLIVYIEGQLVIFQGMPNYLWWLINGIFTTIMIIIIWEAFDSGGIG